MSDVVSMDAEQRAALLEPFEFNGSTEMAARAVDPDKDWSWREDGPVLNEAIDLAITELRSQLEHLAGPFGFRWLTVDREAVKDVITALVFAWDDQFGWDPKRMNEQIEETFYAFQVRARVDFHFKNVI